MEYRFVFDYDDDETQIINKGSEISLTLEAKNDQEAIKRFILEAGEVHFGCFVEDGRVFSSSHGDWKK